MSDMKFIEICITFSLTPLNSACFPPSVSDRDLQGRTRCGIDCFEICNWMMIIKIPYDNGVYQDAEVDEIPGLEVVGLLASSFSTSFTK